MCIREAVRYFNDSSLNSLIHPILKFYVENSNFDGSRHLYIYNCQHHISSARAIFGGQGRLFLTAREVVTTLFIERHFPCVHWPLADVWWIACLLIALTLNLHVFYAAASWSWRCNSACNKKGLSQNMWISVGGDNASCSHPPVRSSSVKKWGVWIGSSPTPTVPYTV